jgi:hypothetical protein
MQTKPEITKAGRKEGRYYKYSINRNADSSQIYILSTDKQIGSYANTVNRHADR